MNNVNLNIFYSYQYKEFYTDMNCLYDKSLKNLNDGSWVCAVTKDRIEPQSQRSVTKLVEKMLQIKKFEFSLYTVIYCLYE